MPIVSIPVVAASVLAALLVHSAAALASQAPGQLPGKEGAPPYRMRNVAIVVFEGVELLDFAGPGEVFAQAHRPEGHAFTVYTVARSREPISSMGFVKVTPQYTLEDCPKPDIVVVPGGHVPSDDTVLREWVRAKSKDAELMMSVCNGALIYASAGLLRGLEVTTHKGFLQSVALLEPEARVFSNRRFVDNGRVLTTAGISAGIDGALHVVGRFCGEDVAWQAARSMEYDWRPDELAKLHAQPGVSNENAEALGWVSSIRKIGVDRAIAEYKKLAKPPTEVAITSWGYTLLNSGEVDAAVDAFRLMAAVFPVSSNASDSLSEALEVKKDVAGSKKAAEECLARLEKDTGLKEERRQLIRNAATSRIARLTGTSANLLRFVCAPCGGSCDDVAYLEAGACPTCKMQLVERSQ